MGHIFWEIKKNSVSGLIQNLTLYTLVLLLLLLLLLQAVCPLLCLSGNNPGNTVSDNKVATEQDKQSRRQGRNVISIFSRLFFRSGSVCVCCHTGVREKYIWVWILHHQQVLVPLHPCHIHHLPCHHHSVLDQLQFSTTSSLTDKFKHTNQDCYAMTGNAFKVCILA